MIGRWNWMVRIGCGFVMLALLFSQISAGTPLNAGESEPLRASGIIETDEFRVASELGGRIVQVLAAEGQRVEKGKDLIVLDAAPRLLELSLVEAAAATAQADLAVVQAGPHAQAILAARAALSLSEAQRDGALAAWENAQVALENPQELQAQLVEARTRLALTEQKVEMAEAELGRQILTRDQTPENSIERRVADMQVLAYEYALAAAQSDQQAAQQLVHWLQMIRREPLQLIAQVNLAEGRYRLSDMQVKVAQARLDDLMSGPTDEEIAVAEAAVRQAEAEVVVLQTEIDQLTLKSPIDGVVLSQSLFSGELAAPAASIMTLADLTEVQLIAYIPANQIGLVRLGQSVAVRVDSFPEREFIGEVVYISDEPEFTPRNVVVTEERVNTLYGVEIRLPNPEGLLKPGVPADATFLGPVE